MSNYSDDKSLSEQSYAQWRRYWDEWHMKRRLHNPRWQQQNSHRHSIEKAVQTLRERYAADLNADAGRQPYPLITWSTSRVTHS